MASNHDEVEIQTSIKKTWIGKMIHLFHLSLQFFRELDKRLTSQGLVRYPESSHCTDLNINDFVFVRRMYLSELENVFPGRDNFANPCKASRAEPPDLNINHSLLSTLSKEHLVTIQWKNTQSIQNISSNARIVYFPIHLFIFELEAKE